MNHKITSDLLWPKELLYWRRMGSSELSEYIKKTPADKRLILFVWGVLEAHGPYLPVANDSHLASVAADKVAYLIYHKHNIQPIIFNSFIDVGSPSATWEFPGAIAYSSYPVPVVQEIWEQTLIRMEKEGFKKFFLVNGDGGNWMSHWARLKWDSLVLRRLVKEKGVQFDGSNWDQEGGEPYPHAGVLDHAFIKWACEFAPEFERFSALRHGLKPAPENELGKIDGVKMIRLESDDYRYTDWSKYDGQIHYRGVTEFSLKRYRELLYNADGSAKTAGGVQADFEAKIEKLMKKVLRLLELRI